MKNLNIRDGRIYFMRSAETSDELKRLGSNRPFKQEFYGEFQRNGTFIKGYYTDTGIENKWQARRK